MSTESIRDAIQAASEYLAQNPEDARATDSAATATVRDGLVVHVSGPNGASLTTDMVSVRRRNGHRAIAGLAPPGSGGQPVSRR